MTTATDVTRREAWLLAARPHTLPAGAAPVVLGVGLAVHEGIFAALPALAALAGALLIQLGTNFANDYFDAVKGADTPEREGFTRVTAGGIIPAERVKLATALSYGLAVVIGLYLVAVGGLPILLVGLSSIVAGVLYTGGPYPYGYYGLGDLFVFVYFGVVAVTGTYYVQAVAVDPTVRAFPLSLPAGAITADVVVASLAIGGLTTAILVVNNVRDIETDRAAGKDTLAVILGYRFSRLEFLALLAIAYLVPVVLVGGFGYPVWILATLASLPLAVDVARTVLTRRDGDALNPALERTGQLLALYALLFTVGLVAPQVA